jgi:hypothetical protein
MEGKKKPSEKLRKPRVEKWEAVQPISVGKTNLLFVTVAQLRVLL